jgi:hypothetical protein
VSASYPGILPNVSNSAQKVLPHTVHHSNTMAAIYIFPFGKPVCSCGAVVVSPAALAGRCAVCRVPFEYLELNLPSWTARERITAS